MTNIINFPTKKVRGWNEIESTVRGQACKLRSPHVLDLTRRTNLWGTFTEIIPKTGRALTIDLPINRCYN